ncbi:hypothetical protein WIW50_10090 [Flavobacteriaceae bacterium 3-367]
MKDILEELIENIDLLENDDSKITEINRILKLVDLDEMEDYKRHYLKGYLWNLMPIEGNERDLEVENNLKKSITLRNDFIYSKTELSYFYFDKKHFIKVIDLLEDLDLSYFEQKDQLWKSLKLQELLAVSKLHTETSIHKELIDDLMNLISSYTYISESELAVPSELVQGVIENKHKDGMKSILTNIYIMITQSGQRKFFDDNLKMQFEKTLNE